jgi:outer membrane protein assembly factor BamB
MTRFGLAVCLAASATTAGGTVSAPPAVWPQFGGPSRDFTTEAAEVRPWGTSGPKPLWERELGDGYSGIVTDGSVLYTQYTPLAWFGLTTRNEEAVVAIEAATGRTVWERRNSVEVLPSMNMQYGPGPHSTPLLAGARVFAVGVTGRLEALDAKTGAVAWARELWKELGGKVMDRGYSCSPLAWSDTVIVAVGGHGGGLVAFGQSDGEIRWKSPSLDVSPSSPVVMDVAGEKQIVYFAAGEVVGLEPETGARLWGHPHPTSYGLNIALPVQTEDGVLLVSSAYSGGTRALRLTRDNDATRVEELWHTNQMRVHHGNLLPIGRHAYGSSGDFGPAPLTAVDLRSGEVVWRDRAFAKAKLVRADDRLVVLDEDGSLGLVRVSPAGLEVEARAEVFSSRSWTAPTLVGSRLYLRDRKKMRALDLS